MNCDWTSANFGRCAHTLAVGAMMVFAAALPTACTSHSSGSGCVFYGNPTLFTFEDDVTVGFDISIPISAVLGIALDGSDAALVIALQYSSAISTGSQFFSPTCDTAVAIDSYSYDDPDTVTKATYDANPYMQLAVTDTNGVLGMDHSMNALLILNNDPDPSRYFLAVSGTIVANRIAGVTAEVVGSLTFVELDGANTTAEILDGGEVLRIDDINFEWTTFPQPMPL